MMSWVRLVSLTHHARAAQAHKPMQMQTKSRRSNTHTSIEPNYEIHLIALLVATSNQLHDEYLICWIVIEFQKNGPIGQLDIRHATNSTVDTLRGNYASQLTNWSVIVLSQLPCRFDILSFFTESHWNHNYPYCRWPSFRCFLPF